MAENDPPIVVEHQTWYGFQNNGTDMAFLPGDEPPEGELPRLIPRYMPPVVCQACQTDMPYDRVLPYDDGDGEELYVCANAESCRSRQEADRLNVESHSFVVDAVNRLTVRVSELEEWRRTSGSVSVVPVVGENSAMVAPTTDPVSDAGLLYQAENPQPDQWVTLGSTENGYAWTEVVADPDTTAHVMSRIGTVGVTLVQADARAVPMNDNSVDLIVTSPPYWAQRSYTDSCPDCAERAKANARNYMERYCPSCGEIRNRNVCTQCNVSTLRTDATKALSKTDNDCKTCGGKGSGHYTGQIGDEPTFDEFIDNLIECTRDWARVLKPSGSIWVNLGDKYSSSSSNESRLGGDGSAAKAAKAARGAVPQVAGMKPKSLLGLPWRYALRCIDELGLILREEVIWSKPNGMPESVTDRCRRSHEQWFHFTLNPAYYSAVDRIRASYAEETAAQYARKGYRQTSISAAGQTKNPVARHDDGGPTEPNPMGKLPPSVWTVPTAGLIVPEWLGVDHYAAFPMELPRRIIQGFSPQDVCTVCGEGRRPHKHVVREGGRIRQKVDNRFLGKPKPEGMSPQSQDAIGAHAGYKTWHTIAGDVCACTPYTDHPGVRVGVEARSGDALVPGNTPRSLGAPAQGPWREYDLDDWVPPATRPAVVLDPFGGTGTTVLVAEMHGRHGVHLDLSADYLKIAEWRTTDPAQRASALQVPKPPVQMDGQMTLDFFGDTDGE